MSEALFDTATVRIPASAPWLSSAVRRRLQGRHGRPFGVRISRAERKVLKKPVPIPVSQWAEKYRVITMSSMPGPWRNESTPYLAGIMDAAAFPGVRTTILCKAPQVGGSEIAHNFIGWAIDRDPGPAMYVYPDELTGRENSRDRIQPMLKSSPRLRSYLSGAADDTAALRISLKHMPIYLAWATSPSRLANKPIRHLILDEVDKYPATSGKREGDPISLAEKRTVTYRESCSIWKISTPTNVDGPIWRAMTREAQAVFDFHVHCPSCGAAQLMVFDQIQWPAGNRDAEQIESERLARYRCPHCQQDWDDETRNRAVASGEWRERTSGRALFAHLEAQRPAKIGFHLPSWLSRFVSLSEVAAAFLRGQRDTAALKIFMTQHKAEPWEEQGGDKLDWEALRDRAEPYGPAVPMAAGVLTCGVDVQDDRLEAEVIAHGRQGEDWSMETRIFPGSPATLNVWRDLDDYLKRRWTHGSGVELPIACTCIDSGGHFTKQVYEFVRKKGHRKIFATKGASTAGQPLVSRPTRSNLGKVLLFKVGTDTAKESVFGRLALTEPGPDYMHFNASDDEYYKQLTGEKQVTTWKNGQRKTEWVKTRARQEVLDLRVLNMAALAILNPNLDKICRDLAGDESAPPEVEQSDEILQDPPARRRRSSRKKSGWVNGWKK